MQGRELESRGKQISISDPVGVFACASVVEKSRANFPSWCPEGIDELLHDKDKAIAEAETLGRPEKQIFGVSSRGGEEYVAEWLKWMGFENVHVTPERRDGGFDIETDDYIIQVKSFSRDWVGVAPVRELYGVAQAEGKLSMFWVRGILSDDAQAFANKVEMPVFQFSPEEGLIQPANTFARDIYQYQLTLRAYKFTVALALGRVFGGIQVLTTFFGAIWALRDHLDDDLNKSLAELVKDIRGRELVGFFFTNPINTVQDTLNNQFIPGPEDHPEFSGSLQDVFSHRFIAIQMLGSQLRALFEEVGNFLSSHKEQLDRDLEEIFRVAKN
jgi:hypothetical protein